MAYPPSFTFEILLAEPVDGQRIEEFVNQKSLRSGGHHVYGPVMLNDKFKSGTPYDLIIVVSHSESFGESIVKDLVKRFGGLWCCTLQDH